MNLQKVTTTRNGKSYPAWTYEGFLQIKKLGINAAENGN